MVMVRSKLLQIRVHPGLYRLSQQAATDRYCDLSDYVRQALRERLERDGYSLATRLEAEVAMAEAK